MKQTIKRTIIAGAAIALLAAPAIASAEDSSSTVSANASASVTVPTGVSLREKILAVKAQLQAKIAAAKAAREAAATSTVDTATTTAQDAATAAQTTRDTVKAKLSDRAKAICEAKKVQLTQVMTKIIEKRQLAYNRVDQIATAATTFVTTKKLSEKTGEDLEAKIAAGKAVAQSILSKQLTPPVLDCSGDHPHVDIAQFKAQNAETIDSLKLYVGMAKAYIQGLKVKLAAQAGAQ